MATLQKAPTGSEAEARVLALLKTFDTAVLVTHAPAGRMHGRPMAVAQVDDDATLWFVTSLDSTKLDEIMKEPRALVALQSSRQFVCTNGEIEIVTDRARLKELWKESFKVWFKDENDPNIALLKYVPSDAEYWDTSGMSGVKYAVRAVKAAVSGEKPKGMNDPELHGRIGR
jgi:general stress protein 26